MQSITIEAYVTNTIERVWKCWTTPADIMIWNHASDDWHCPHVENDVRVGGRFTWTMAAKDGSERFDFSGTYTEVVSLQNIAYVMDKAEDGSEARSAATSFESIEGGVRVTTTFDMEQYNTEELQRAGWQAILDNFKKHVEAEA
jgi:uncharacterized protein YndB with AHSA1/START domain